MKNDQVLKTLSETLGVDPSEIKVRSANEWVRLMKSGVLVELHIRRWRGVTRLSLEDLGLEKDDADQVVDELIRLGDKYLLPVEVVKELNAIDTGARKNLEKYAVKTYWGAFLTAESYLEWKDENDRFVSRYYAIRDRIVEKYDDYRLVMVDQYARAARAAYRRQKAISEAGGGLAAAVEDVFVERFVDRVINLIPSKSQIEASFDFEIDLSFVPLPSLLAEDFAENEMKRIEIEKAREMSEAEIQMRRDVLETARREKERLVSGFMRDLVSQINDAVYNAAADILESVDKNGGLHPRSVVQLGKLIERVRALNFFGYDEVEKMISEAEAIVGNRPDARNVDDIKAKLSDIATITRSTLIGLGATPRSARKVGIVDVPTPEIVREARGRLGIVDVEVAELGAPRRTRREAEIG